MRFNGSLTKSNALLDSKWQARGSIRQVDVENFHAS